MFKVGDKVVCVEATKGVTYGKVYTVLGGNKWSDMSVIEIADDEDEKSWYYTSRFTSAIITNPDPMVSISQTEYDNLVEEINMLQELIAELSAPVDTAQEQQAETYRALQMLLVSHPSFQDGAGENTTHCEELVNTVMELQAAWDRLTSTPKKDVTDTTGFKPISEYTLADWEQACKEDWVFECRNGSNVRIMYTHVDADYVLRGDDELTRTVDGHWLVGETGSDDIVKRVK